ncbi:hypothetical protein [Hymenobacter perfusus]|uniref:Uncharacterized protein n=1 Tax=Hymenobacter perfusus TaxID=1236770 RepID=A0A428JXW4_9BACT|nr:hypothetical protein [Hymenobacter perfusus]RSK38985.1 hypothetical protein EI293_20910 [Hymenobacter perfusus]
MPRPLPPLTYELYGQQQPLPEWLKYFTELGSLLATEKNDLVTVGVMAPTDLFIAPFCALGFILGRLEEPAHSPALAKEWGDFLLTMQGLTPVSYFRNGKLKQGWMAANRPCRRLELTFNRATKASPHPAVTLVSVDCPADMRRVLAIRPINVSQDEFILRRNRVRVSSELVFLNRFLDGYPLPDFIATSQPDCVLFGNHSHLISQCESRFGFSDKENVSGRLEDVLRIRDSSNAWRTAVLTDRAPCRPVLLQGTPPGVVIFVGHTAWFRFKSRFPHSHHLVITTHDHFGTQEVVSDLLNAATVRKDGFSLGESPTPPGMEVIAFRRNSLSLLNR